MKVKYKYLFASIFIIVITLFSVYVVLDTLVISSVYVKVEDDIENDDINIEQTDVTITENSYSDENISITINTYRQYNTNIYVADVTINDIEQLKSAFAKNSYGKNITEKTSTIAENNNAILAINGDYYGVQEKGFVLRNGVIYRESISTDQEDLVIYNDGSFGLIAENNTNLSDLLTNGAYQVLSFGPTLINNYEINVSVNTEVGKAMASNPRTAIGIIDNLHYIFVVADGRTSESDGLSLYELACVLKELDVSIAYNLDGGGSSTMYFNGQVINNPTTNGKTISERSVSDIIYVGY